ncbi:DNA primase family protein [Cytobacillus sp. NCCP-133]|uniref:DNA primase family protein n=1 Tax=Cytobacillus sp. NCCP-133 TaxID=766848 RepID=UPI0022319B8A|nr:DNA primase family protein [Cytobacillus sp. NCCP-133]GLB58652.1 hypothetical protein NCCP133_07850 [Cytobacillus sp. NCCP-133]
MTISKITSHNVNTTSKEYIDALIEASRKKKQPDTMIDEDIFEEDIPATQIKEKKETKKAVKKEAGFNAKQEKVVSYIAPFIKEGKFGPYVHRGLLAEYLITEIPAINSAGQLYIYENGVYRLAIPKEEQGIVKKLLTPEFSTMPIINDVTQQWMIDERVNKSTGELNDNLYKLNLLNGYINLKNEKGELVKSVNDLKLEDHTPDYLSTIQVQANFSKEAKGEHFLKFLDSSVPDKKMQMLLQEMVGYSLTGLTDSKKMIFIFDGPGDSGKSTFINATLENLLSENAKSHVELQELGDNEYKQAELFEKVVNIYADLPSKGIQDIGYLKAASGNDWITARRIYGHPFQFKNKAKFVFSTNGMPANYSKDTSDAFYNRLTIIPFKQVPKKKDLTLKDKLFNEKDFIFMWALEGLLRLVNNGFKFSESEVADQLIQDYKQENNPVMRFVNEACEFGEYTIARASLYAEYENFCKLNGHNPLSAIKFNKELEKAYPELQKKQLSDARRTKAWVGIRVLDFMDI